MAWEGGEKGTRKQQPKRASEDEIRVHFDGAPKTIETKANGRPARRAKGRERSTLGGLHQSTGAHSSAPDVKFE